MENKLKHLINIYKAMIKGYDELIEEGEFAKPILQAKKGTMTMVIEDLEKLLESDSMIKATAKATIDSEEPTIETVRYLLEQQLNEATDMDITVGEVEKLTLENKMR